MVCVDYQWESIQDTGRLECYGKSPSSSTTNYYAETGECTYLLYDLKILDVGDDQASLIREVDLHHDGVEAAIANGEAVFLEVPGRTSWTDHGTLQAVRR